jgi:hypothetical protein
MRWFLFHLNEVATMLRRTPVIVLLFLVTVESSWPQSGTVSPGNFRMVPAEAAIGPVQLIVDGKETTSKESYLKLVVTIENLNKNRNLEYDQFPKAALVSPSTMEKFVRAKLPPKTSIKDHSEAGKFKPGETIKAILLFNPPKDIDKIRLLRLSFSFDGNASGTSFKGDSVKRPEK